MTDFWWLLKNIFLGQKCTVKSWWNWNTDTSKICTCTIVEKLTVDNDRFFMTELENIECRLGNLKCPERWHKVWPLD